MPAYIMGSVRVTWTKLGLSKMPLRLPLRRTLGELLCFLLRTLLKRPFFVLYSNLFMKTHKRYLSLITEPDLVVCLLNKRFTLISWILRTVSMILSPSSLWLLGSSELNELLTKLLELPTDFVHLLHTYYHHLPNTSFFASCSSAIFYLILFMVSIFLNNPIIFRRE